jgi:hypothetical protein
MVDFRLRKKPRQKLRAAVAGLDSLEWRSPVVYGTDLEDGGVPRAP